jgi:hypothetical protein
VRLGCIAVLGFIASSLFWLGRLGCKLKAYRIDAQVNRVQKKLRGKKVNRVRIYLKYQEL